MKLLPTTAADDRLPVREVIVLWLLVAVAVGVFQWPKLDDALVSTDNVMRMVEVRALLDGAPWFDPHEARFAPPLGYDTHWSRLIDAGIAGLILLARQFVAADLAERLARCIWPLLMSGPAVGAAAAIAVRLGGAGAGRATLIIALPTMVLFATFKPGEIDHHNAQVMLALVLSACAVWCELPLAAAGAGIVGGLLLSIGLEAAHVLIAVAATLALVSVRDPTFLRPMRTFALALAATAIAGYLVETPAAFRFASRCDALAVNSTSAVAAGAIALAIVGQFGQRWTPLVRLLTLGVGAAIAAGVFIGFEPRCLRGPFGLIDRSVFPLWLDRVQEMQSVPQLFKKDGVAAIVYVAAPLVAALSVAWVAASRLRTPVAWALVAAFAISVAVMFNQIRIIVYVIWLGLPFIGVAAQMLGKRTPRVALVRLAAATLASPVIVSLVATDLTASAAQEASEKADHEIANCFRPEAYRALAALAPGLVLGPLDLGPSLLANTPHGVVAAPYHRADKAIRFNQEVMDGPAQIDPRRVIDRGVNYVVTCTAYKDHVEAKSFHEALLAGNPGAWLSPVATPEGDILKIWRVIK